MEDLDTLRKALSTALAEQPAVQLAVMFGSLARGRGHAQSDVDLALCLEPNTAATRREAIAAAGRAVRRDVDVIDLDTAPPLLAFKIAHDGVVLVERKSGLWTRFKARAMVTWWDWAPTARKIEAAYIRRLREQVSHAGP